MSNHSGNLEVLRPRGAVEDAIRRAATGPAYAIMLARVVPFAAVLCQCKNVCVFVMDMHAASPCPVCGALYFISAISYEHRAPDGDAQPQPVKIQIARAEPPLVRPVG